MSDKMQPDHPDELRFAYWDKKKGSLPSGHEVGDKLKALQKKHDAVDWKQEDEDRRFKRLFSPKGPPPRRLNTH
jgi:hypothetical protein